MTQLSVNVNKIAVLRNSRGGTEPDVVRAAQACLDAGAHGITVHPRPDRRHITAEDVLALSALGSGVASVLAWRTQRGRGMAAVAALLLALLGLLIAVPLLVQGADPVVANDTIWQAAGSRG